MQVGVMDVAISADVHSDRGMFILGSTAHSVGRDEACVDDRHAGARPYCGIAQLVGDNFAVPVIQVPMKDLAIFDSRAFPRSADPFPLHKGSSFLDAGLLPGTPPPTACLRRRTGYGVGHVPTLCRRRTGGSGRRKPAILRPPPPTGEQLHHPGDDLVQHRLQRFIGWRAYLGAAWRCLPTQRSSPTA